MADENSMEEGYLQRLGIAVDELLNVALFRGRPDQTISLHAALEQRKGTRWACVLCAILSKAVEADHCEKQFLPGPTGTMAAIRSALAMGVLLLGLFGFCVLARHLLALLGLDSWDGITLVAWPASVAFSLLASFPGWREIPQYLWALLRRRS